MACTHRVLISCLIVAGAAVAQDAARMRQTLEYLASPELQGRESGQPGCVKAATYLAGKMQALGLATLSPTGMGGETPYHHPYTLSSYLSGGFTLNGTTLLPGLHYTAHGAPAQSGETVFLGYGLKTQGQDDFAGREVRGKWVVALEGLPDGSLAENLDAGSVEAKARAAAEAGALGLVLVHRPESSWPAIPIGSERLRLRPRFRDLFPLPAAEPLGRLPRIHVNEEGARLLRFFSTQGEESSLAQARSLGLAEPQNLTPGLASTASNLVGVIPGTDPALASEYVLVSAHYDHIGLATNGGYYPGADDNASGTAGLLEMATLLKGTSPRRSILFLACSGEEKGLLGSAAFASAPPVSLSKIVANVNLDMLGRNATRTLYVTPAAVSGYVTTLVTKARELVKSKDLDLSKGIDQYWRQSDHYTFAQRSIPVVFFNSGDHADLHQVTDTANKIDYVKMTRAVDLARDLVLAVANDSAKPASVSPTVYNAWTWPVVGSSAATAPSITTQPVSVTTRLGSTATFTVVATGSAPLSYQWYRGTTAIPGATAATYITGATVTSDSGATFYVKVSNAKGSVNSSAATLTVILGSSDTVAPTVSASESGTSGTISLNATATDNVAVTRVEWYVDSLLKGSDTAAPYGVNLDSTALANGTHALVAKAYDAAGNVGTSPAVNFTVNNVVTTGELMTNGGFETGTTGWSGSTGAIGTWSGQPAYQGTRYAWLGGNGSTNTENLYQTVTIPNTAASAVLSLFLHIDTAETTTTTAYDKCTIRLRNTSGTTLATLATYSNLDKAAGYVQKSFDVSAYKGKTLRIYITSTEDRNLQTSFVFDNVSLALR